MFSRHTTKRMANRSAKFMRSEGYKVRIKKNAKDPYGNQTKYLVKTVGKRKNY